MATLYVNSRTGLGIASFPYTAQNRFRLPWRLWNDYNKTILFLYQSLNGENLFALTPPASSTLRPVVYRARNKELNNSIRSPTTLSIGKQQSFFVNRCESRLQGQEIAIIFGAFYATLNSASFNWTLNFTFAFKALNTFKIVSMVTFFALRSNFEICDF